MNIDAGTLHATGAKSFFKKQKKIVVESKKGKC